MVYYFLGSKSLDDLLNLIATRLAGFYVPYIANYLYEHPGLVPLELKGTWITDPSVSWDIVSQDIPALPFAKVCIMMKIGILERDWRVELCHSIEMERSARLHRHLHGNASAQV